MSPQNCVGVPIETHAVCSMRWALPHSKTRVRLASFLERGSQAKTIKSNLVSINKGAFIGHLGGGRE